MAEMKPRRVRKFALIAEEIEEEASSLPPSHKEEADVWRKLAGIFRKFDDPKMLRAWKEPR